MQRVKLGDIVIDVVTSENPRDSVTVTSRPVEAGVDIADHAKQQPSILDISGQIMGEDASDRLQILKKYQKDSVLLKYIGRNIYNNMILVDLDRSHSVTNAKGFGFNMTLKQVKIATAKEIQINVVSPKTKKVSKKTNTQVKKKTNNGKQQLQTKSSSPMKSIVDQGKIDSLSRSPGGTMKAITSLYTKPPKKTLYSGGLF